MKNYWICLLLFLFAAKGFSQSALTYNFAKFAPMQSTGALPPEVEMSGKDFMSTSQKNIDKGGDKYEKKAKEQFVLQSSYSVKDLFTSGKLLFNDPISDYVEKVRKEVTKSDPQLASETKVYVVKSSVINAFATNQGYIFITTGLLSQLENEAQLAFILCHELIHYKNKHVVKTYIEDDRIDHDNASYRRNDVDGKFLDKANYSKENESEADNDGFDLFTTTGYSVDAINDVFTVLKYAELPFDEIEFKAYGFLETEFLIFPNDYYLKNVDDPEGADEDEDDRHSTHPNLNKRRNDVARKVKEVKAKGSDITRSEFVISKPEFYAVRKLARFDLCHTNLIDRDYDRALYHAYCLLQDDPDNVYLKKIALKSLYGITQYTRVFRSKEVVDKSYKDMQGESQRLNYLLTQIGKNEMNVIALNYAWRLKKSLKETDVEVDLITDDLFYGMVRYDYPEKTLFATEPKPVTPLLKDDVSSKHKNAEVTGEKGDDDDDEDRPRSKLAKIKKNQKKVIEDSYITYAFVDLLKDSGFVAAFDKAKKQVDDEDMLEDSKHISKYGKHNKKKFTYADEDDDEDRWIKNSIRNGNYNPDEDTYALDIDKVLVFNPFYLRIDERKKVPVLFSSTEQSQLDFNKRIMDMSKNINLDVEIIDKNKLNTTDVDYYNDMAVLNDWMDEGSDHKTINILPTDYNRVDEISKKYGTQYLTRMGAINFIEKKNGIMTFLCIYASFIPYTWPFTFPYLFKKLDYTYVYTTVYNLKTGKPEMAKFGRTKNPDKGFILNSFLYDYMKQIKRTTSNNK